MSHFFILVDEQRRKNAIALIECLNPKRTYSVEIKEYRKNRSTAQNRLYRMWVNIICKDTGYEDDELHEAFKREFLGYEEKCIFGQMHMIAKSTTKLSTKEFTHYLEKIEIFALSRDIRLPHPDEYMYAMGYEPAQNAASSRAGSSEGRHDDPHAGKPEGARATAALSGERRA